MREINGLDGGTNSTSNKGEKRGQWMRDEAAFTTEADGEGTTTDEHHQPDYPPILPPPESLPSVVMIDEVGLDYNVENARVLTSTTRA
ncbi:hypothetical protein ARMGADRAFT_1077789 [Armillaria gallica]|uniref:Uncharacterized protein n=1 Tax=Armillaria gallica TaxID=47427 RepID=A0A2H3DMD5_ARMGA|nr:hypothetical protein ARMGADRAFT_1077789 [Armillaria gallica]